MASTEQDAKLLEMVAKKLKDAANILTQNGYDDWDEYLQNIVAEIADEAKGLKAA